MRRRQGAVPESWQCLLAILLLAVTVPAAAQESGQESGQIRPQDGPASEQDAPQASDLPGSERGIELEPLTVPALDGLETAVAESLEQSLRVAEATLLQSGIDAATAAETYGSLGVRFDAHGIDEVAAAAYRNAALLMPGDFRWPYALGFLRHRASQLDLATLGYRAALDRQPDFVPAMVRWGQILLEQNELAGARQLADRALATAPDEPAAQALAGEIALAAGDWDDAIRHLESALAAVPEAERLHYPLALAYRGIGDAERARQHLALRGMVGVAPADPLAAQLEAVAAGERIHLLRGQRAFRAGSYEDAVLAFSAAVDANPESVTARINLAAALEARGDAAEALAQLQVAERLAPANPTLLYNLGVALADGGELAAAASRLRRYLAARPTDAEAWIRLARVELRRDDSAAAAVAARRAFEHAAGDLSSLAAASELLGTAGERDEALALLEELRRTSAAEPRVELALARLLISGDATEQDLRRGLDLATALYAGGRSADAAAVASAASALMGRCDEALAWQGRALAGMDDGEATERLERSLKHYHASRCDRH